MFFLMFFLYVSILMFRIAFWCFAAMIWLCLALGAWVFVLCAVSVIVWFDPVAAQSAWIAAVKALAPPEYLKVK